MTLEAIHQKLNRLAHSGMEDNHYSNNPSSKVHNTIRSHSVKKERRRLTKEFSVQLSLFD
ncbi:hypothetical protein MWU78_07440 [Arenibacter sp. F26102]|uniref:hypothetical protein n=1 Tax=Arenibacter sp. F26102 TaxID=2926416 RepID=UPI001FF3C7FC|nr:hypothetical protein [Arenibacter sp. F26102]MCK0145470.1 hypothetical protein [Arenibacter sp. F26102]